MLTGPFVVAVLLAGSVLTWPRPGPIPSRRRALIRGLDGPDGAGSRAGLDDSGPVAGEGFLPRSIQALRRLRGQDPEARGPALEREVLALVEGLAAVLRAGLAPARAMRHLATGGLEVDGPTRRQVLASDLRGAGAGAGIEGRPGSVRARAEMRRLVAVLADQAESGARLESVWRGAAERLRSPALTAVAEGWGLSERSGAPVVPVLDALVAALRDDARVAAAIESSLAAPRATAALLGVLPLGGVILGELVGVHPVAILVGTGVGRIGLCAGLIATLGGRLWMARLVRAAEVR